MNGQQIPCCYQRKISLKRALPDPTLKEQTVSERLKRGGISSDICSWAPRTRESLLLHSCCLCVFLHHIVRLPVLGDARTPWCAPNWPQVGPLKWELQRSVTALIVEVQPPYFARSQNNKIITVLGIFCL